MGSYPTHITNFVRDNGKSLQVHWDDLEIWKDRRPVEIVPADVKEGEIVATEEEERGCGRTERAPAQADEIALICKTG